LTADVRSDAALRIILGCGLLTAMMVRRSVSRHSLNRLVVDFVAWRRPIRLAGVRRASLSRLVGLVFVYVGIGLRLAAIVT